jgi:hypothetical protein
MRDGGTASGRMRASPRGGSGPRRCAFALEAAGQAAARQRRVHLSTLAPAARLPPGYSLPLG